MAYDHNVVGDQSGLVHLEIPGHHTFCDGLFKNGMDAALAFENLFLLLRREGTCFLLIIIKTLLFTPVTSFMNYGILMICTRFLNNSDIKIKGKFYRGQ